MAKENIEWVKLPILRDWDRVERLLTLIGTHKAYICGGYARWLCSQRSKPKNCFDIDIYCHDEKVFDKMLAKLKKAGHKIKNENEVCIIFERENGYGRPIQLIKPIDEFRLITKGKVETILANFDFTVARAAVASKSHCIVDKDFVEDDKKSILRIKNIHCPISSAIRMMKYGKKGYVVRPSEVFKLFLDWEDRPEGYKLSMRDLFQRSESGEISPIEITQLEKLLRRD